MTPLDTALAGTMRVGIDTGPLIYLVEGHPDFEAVPIELVQRASGGHLELVTSIITLTEVLVQPIKQNARNLIADYRDILLNSDQITVYDLNSGMAETAARLRAKYGIRTPDAIQLATAIETGCGAFVTNDKRLRQVSEVNVLHLGDLTL